MIATQWTADEVLQHHTWSADDMRVEHISMSMDQFSAADISPYRTSYIAWSTSLHYSEIMISTMTCGYYYVYIISFFMLSSQWCQVALHKQDYLGADLSYHGLITAGADLGTLATGDNVTWYCIAAVDAYDLLTEVDKQMLQCHSIGLMPLKSEQLCIAIIASCNGRALCAWCFHSTVHKHLHH